MVNSSAPLDLLAGVVAQEAAALATRTPATSTTRTRRGSGGVRKPRSTNTNNIRANTSTNEEDADSKRALRAERNRQSAAASRDRKKQHLRELENQVRYLSEMATTLQYKSHVDLKEWREKKAAYEAENARLAKLLNDALADNQVLRRQLETLRGNSGSTSTQTTHVPPIANTKGATTITNVSTAASLETNTNPKNVATNVSAGRDSVVV